MKWLDDDMQSFKALNGVWDEPFMWRVEFQPDARAVGEIRWHIDESDAELLDAIPVPRQLWFASAREAMRYCEEQDQKMRVVEYGDQA